MNGPATLSVSWDDVLWAAVTVGRPNRHYVFRHGDASIYEAIFRWSMVRMAVEQRGPTGSRLCRTIAAKTLDPTEKGAVNYFLGMTFCKLFASKLLNTPWLLHLDVFRPQLNPLLKKRSRPDLVGREHGTTRWHAFECKGRISPPDSTVKSKAKTQANSLVSVNGTACSLHVGAITYFQADVLHFYWCDPSPNEKYKVEVQIGGEVWRYYYMPIIETMRHADPKWYQKGIGTSLNVEEVDLEVSVHPAIAQYLFNEQWESVQQAANEAATEIAHDGYQSDGLMVRAGPSWSKRFEESPAVEE